MSSAEISCQCTFKVSIGCTQRVKKRPMRAIVFSYFYKSCPISDRKFFLVPRFLSFFPCPSYLLPLSITPFFMPPLSLCPLPFFLLCPPFYFLRSLPSLSPFSFSLLTTSSLLSFYLLTPFVSCPISFLRFFFYVFLSTSSFPRPPFSFLPSLLLSMSS